MGLVGSGARAVGRCGRGKGAANRGQRLDAGDAQPSPERTSAKLREVDLRLDEAMKTARHHHRIARAEIEEADDGICAGCTSAPHCESQPGPMLLDLVAGEGFEPSTFGL